MTTANLELKSVKFMPAEYKALNDNDISKIQQGIPLISHMTIPLSSQLEALKNSFKMSQAFFSLALGTSNYQETSVLSTRDIKEGLYSPFCQGLMKDEKHGKQNPTT